MTESFRLLLYALAWLSVLIALGIGPAAILSGRRYPWLNLAPVFGLVFGSALLTTASVVLTAGAAAYAVLIPAAAISVALLLLVKARMGWEHLDQASLIPFGLGLVGIAVALTPGFAKDTVGPFTYAVGDVWLHITKGLWLTGHTSEQAADSVALAHRLPLYTGWTETLNGFRLGLPALNAAFARLIGARPGETYFALSGVIFGLLPGTIWIVARRLGAGLIGATIGAAYGIAACALTLVVDGAAENLGGLVVAPLAFLFGFEAMREGGARRLVRAGVMAGGLLAIYPEYAPPLAVAGLIVGIGGLYRLARARSATFAMALGARRLLSLAAVALVVAPYSITRDVTYYRWLVHHSGGAAVRHLTLEDTGAWAFGILHLYQLQNVGLLSAPKKAIVIGFPIVLGAVAAVGLWRRFRVAAPVVFLPGAVSVVLAVYLYWHRTNNEYALWKWLLLALPMLFVLVALGVDSLLDANLHRALARAAVVTIVAAAAAAVVRADVRFTQLVDNRATYVDADLRDLVADADHLRNPSIFLEGADATPYPLVDYVALYSTLLGIPGARVSYDPSAGAPAAQGNQLLRPALPASAYERPDYRYLLTTFDGLARPERVIAQRGRYALLESSPTEVLINGISSWVSVRRRTLPYATTPFELWVKSPLRGRVRVVVETALSPTRTPLLALRVAGQSKLLRTLTEPGRICATVPVRHGFTRIDVQPLSGAPTAVAINEWESDSQRISGAAPVTEAPGVLIRSLAATEGSCRRRPRASSRR